MLEDMPAAWQEVSLEPYFLSRWSAVSSLHTVKLVQVLSGRELVALNTWLDREESRTGKTLREDEQKSSTSVARAYQRESVNLDRSCELLLKASLDI